MLLLKIRIRDEDRFGILLQLLKSHVYLNVYSIENIDTEDKNYMFFIIEYHHPKFINKLLLEIGDISEVIGFPIEYCFVYNKLEAYTGKDTITRREIPYNILNSFGLC